MEMTMRQQQVFAVLWIGLFVVLYLTVPILAVIQAVIGFAAFLVLRSGLLNR